MKGKVISAAVLGMIFTIIFSSTVMAFPCRKEVIYLEKKGKKYRAEETWWDLNSLKKTSDLSGLKSSNTKVAVVKKAYNGREVSIYVKAKKPGKTKISFDIKMNGRKRHIVTVLVVKKYSNPFKSFKIGKADVAKKIAAYDSGFHSRSYSIKKALKNQKIKIKLKKGWKFN